MTDGGFVNCGFVMEFVFFMRRSGAAGEDRWKLVTSLMLNRINKQEKQRQTYFPAVGLQMIIRFVLRGRSWRESH